MDKAYTTYADITPELNAQWEAKYGKRQVLDIEIKLKDEPELVGKHVEDHEAINAKLEAEAEAEAVTYRFVLRKPDRAVLEAIGRHAANKDISNVNKTLMKNCVLGGDMEAIEKDGSVYLNVLEQINLLKSKAQSTVKKR